MILEILSKQANASNWIIAGLKRRGTNLNDTTDEICEEVADELGFIFEHKENGNLSFEDIQCI